MAKKSSSVFTISNLVFVVAECLTMFLHTFWGCMSHVPSNYVVDLGNRSFITVEVSSHSVVATALLPAFQTGLGVWMLIVLWWKIYVTHFNPVVSVGLLLIGEFSAYMLIPYVIAQCIGAIIGAAAAKMLRGDDIGPYIITDDADIPAIICVEIILTGVLCLFIFMNVGDKTYDQQTGPLSIGMMIFQGTLAGRWVGAGVLNPARALGPAVVLGGAAWNYHWVWWISDTIGAVLFAVIYKIFFAPPDKAWIYKLQKEPQNTSSSTLSLDEKEKLHSHA